MWSCQKLFSFCFLLVSLKLAGQTPVVKTHQGYIKGVTEHGVAVFSGIPYAQPPMGSLRYRPPMGHAPWKDTLSTVQFGPAAMQPASGGASGSEDCLYLNLYTPGIDNHKRAVVIWVHGGSMTGGSGKGMDGHAFADQDDIVTITINYRLGALGFLYLGDLGKEYQQSGNLGLLDVIAALRWVHDNIAAFGGDPNRVTVMGESAGAKLLSAVMVAPASKGLFQQAILESGAVQCIRDTGTAGRARALLLKQLGFGPKDARKLLTTGTDVLFKAQAKVCAGIGGNSFFGPVYDGVTIQEDGYQYAREGQLSGVRVIIGTNENEGAAFIPRNDMGNDPNASIFQPLFRSNAPRANAYYQAQLGMDSPYAAMVRTLTQYMYQLHSYRFASALSDAGGQVYMYRYNYQNGRAFGARHGDELHYIWGAAGILNSNDDAVKKQLARSLHGAWVSFIRTGDPQWPGYKDTDRRVMVFSDVDTVTRLQEVYDDKDFPSPVFVIAAGGRPVQMHGRLKVVGTRLMDENDQPYALHGMSFGWSCLWPRFYNADAVEWLYKDWNCSVVRAAMGVELKGGYIENPAGSKALIGKVVDGAIKAGVYVLIDWHSHHVNLEEAKGFFGEMAAKYNKYPNIIYELFNEPAEADWPQVKAYAEAVIKVIREKDPDNIILVGCPRWDQEVQLPAADPIKGYKNLMYTMHFYAGTHKQWLRDRTDSAITAALPVFVSESAGMEASGDGPIDYKEWQLYIDWLNKNNLSWIAWSVSDKHETCSVLNPSASSTGDWKDRDIKEAGVKAREYLRAYQP